MLLVKIHGILYHPHIFEIPFDPAVAVLLIMKVLVAAQGSLHIAFEKQALNITLNYSITVHHGEFGGSILLYKSAVRSKANDFNIQWSDG